MSQAGRITWGEFEIPQAASSTFAKSGGMQSAASLGAGRAYSIAKDGGIESEWATSDFWRDNFERVVGSGSLGNADLGGAYTLSGTAADFSVSGGLGRVQGTDNYYAILNSLSVLDGEFSFKVALSALPVGATLAFDFLTRVIDTSNYFSCSLRFISTGRVDVLLRKTVAGVTTDIFGPSTQITTGSYTAGAFVRCKLKVQGGIHYFKVWLDGGTEPAWSTAGGTFTQFSNAGALGFRINTVGVTNNPEVRFDEVSSVVGSAGSGQKVTNISKSGGNISAASTGASRVIQHSKSAGSETNDSAVGPGARATQVNKFGGIVSTGTVGGSQASQGPIQRNVGYQSAASLGAARNTNYIKLGGISTSGKFGTAVRGRILWSEFEIPSASSSTFAKSGGIQSGAVLGGFRIFVNIFNRTGGISSAGSLGGSKLVNLWSDWSTTRSYTITSQPVKTGGTIGPVSLGGVRIIQHNKVVGIVSPASLGGIKEKIVSKIGGISSAASLGGTENRQQTTAKSGGFTSAASTGAPKGFSASKVGGILSVGSLGGSKAYSAAKGGGIIARGVLIGDVSISSAFAKTGGISTRWTSSGDKGAIFAKSGGIESTFRTGAGEIYKSGGIRSSASAGANRSVQHIKLGGTISSSSTSATKFIFFTKDAAGIASAGKIGADFAGQFPREGGISSVLSFGGDKNVPLRNIPVAGGFSSSLTLGADFVLRKVTTGGMVSTGRLGEQPNIGIRSAARLGGTVSFTLKVRPGADDQILSVTIGETKLISVSDHDDQAILLGGKL